MTPLLRFFAKVKQTHTCWIWVGEKGAGGYGNFMYPVKGKYVNAHKFSYLHHKGHIPDGLVIDHLCRNRLCVNPDHLEAVPGLENIRRGLLATKTHCKNGHPFSEENTYWLKRSSKNHAYRVCRACRRTIWNENYRRKRIKAQNAVDQTQS